VLSLLGGNRTTAAVGPPVVAVGTEKLAVAVAGIDAAEPVVWDLSALGARAARIVDASYSQSAAVAAAVDDSTDSGAQTEEREQRP
jgi:hypothetical protein